MNFWKLADHLGLWVSACKSNKPGQGLLYLPNIFTSFLSYSMHNTGLNATFALDHWENERGEGGEMEGGTGGNGERERKMKRERGERIANNAVRKGGSALICSILIGPPANMKESHRLPVQILTRLVFGTRTPSSTSSLLPACFLIKSVIWRKSYKIPLWRSWKSLG